MVFQPQQQRKQGVSAFTLTTSLKLAKVAGNWDDKLVLPSLDPGCTPEKRMRSGLQKQHRLRKGRACQASFPWCFSMTSLGSVSYLLKPRECTRESHKHWILKECLHFTLSCRKIPMRQRAGVCLISHVSIPQQLSPTTSSCLKTGVFSSLCALPGI